MCVRLVTVEQLKIVCEHFNNTCLLARKFETVAIIIVNEINGQGVLYSDIGIQGSLS